MSCGSLAENLHDLKFILVGHKEQKPFGFQKRKPITEILNISNVLDQQKKKSFNDNTVLLSKG